MKKRMKKRKLSQPQHTWTHPIQTPHSTSGTRYCSARHCKTGFRKTYLQNLQYLHKIKISSPQLKHLQHRCKAILLLSQTRGRTNQRYRKYQGIKHAAKQEMERIRDHDFQDSLSNVTVNYNSKIFFNRIKEWKSAKVSHTSQLIVNKKTIKKKTM